MSEYTLSVVQVCPDQFRDAANMIAEAAGYGPNNLSVELRDGSNNVWWGCHAWWMPSALAAQMQLPPEAPAEWHAALAAVVTSVQEIPAPTGGEAQQHWQAALAVNGLSVLEVQE